MGGRQGFAFRLDTPEGMADWRNGGILSFFW
jgi:hypothetical protein